MNKTNSITTIKLISIITLSFVLGAIITICIIYLSNSIINMNKNNTQIYEKTSIASSINKVYDGVVTIIGYEEETQSNIGSGFIYKIDNKYAYIITNQHVVDNKDSIKVLLNDSEIEIESKLLGADEYLDLAVIRIEKSNIKTVLKLGNSEKINIGDFIYTIGTPIGIEYKGTVSSGIISGKERLVSVKVNNKKQNNYIMRVLQVDAAINHGNSGGPLLNINGEVIGVCSMKLEDEQIEGIGFAIPVEYIKKHISTLEKGKKIEWPVIGIKTTNINDISTLYKFDIKINNNINNGIVITGVNNNSIAQNSNLQKGDIIIKVDDKKIKDTSYFRYQLYQHIKGEIIKITIVRDGKEKTINLKL